MQKSVVLILMFILFSLSFASAVQPTQQSNKIFLNPFYRGGLIANTANDYSVVINPPDGVNSISSALVSFDVYYSPSVNFTILVNGQKCNTPSYYISTTYATASQGRITFDCSNVITSAKIFNISIKTSKDTGAINGWLDLTYTNKPVGALALHGTEYTSGRDLISKVWLQVLSSNNTPITNAVCYLDVYTPNQASYITSALMTNTNVSGIFYYDFPVPVIPGVYSSVAVCYYLASPGQTSNYVESYSVIIGSWDSGTIENTYTTDGNFMRFKETTVNPVRNISIELNITNGTLCKNIAPELLSGVSFLLTGRFDSVPNDVITMQVWNYSSSGWLNLSNVLTEGAGFKSVSNSFVFNNITQAGLVTASGSTIRTRFIDTKLADTATSNLDIDKWVMTCDTFTSPEWQQVKGSSEVHVTSIIEKQFYAETLCGSNENNLDTSACSMFENNLSYWNKTWGYLYDSIVFINSYQSDTDSYYVYETSKGQDCTALINITYTPLNGNTTDFSSNVTLSLGTKDNCLIHIPVIFNSSDREFDVVITQDNYMKWEVQRDKDYVQSYQLSFVPFCNQIAVDNNNPFTIPIDALGGSVDISTLYANNSIYLGCYRSLDDLYWFNYYYAESLNINLTGEYESYLTEIRYYFPEIKDNGQIISQITTSNVLSVVMSSCGETMIGKPVSSHCSEIKVPDALFSSQEGYIVENITAINYFNGNIDATFEYITGKGVDCTAVFQVLKQNGTTTDIIDDVHFESYSNDNCLLEIPLNYVEGQPTYQIEIYMENYIYWDIYWARDLVNSLNDTIMPFCLNISINRSVNYIIPINSSIEAWRNDSELYFCYRAVDDVYWWYFFYDKIASEGYTTIGPTESIHYESEFFWVRILDDYNVIKTYQRNLNQVQTLQEIMDLRDNLANRVWNFTNRTLSEFNFNISVVGIVNVNTTQVGEAVWGYNGTISSSILSQFANAIWALFNNTYDFITTITNSVWTRLDRNLTFYAPGIDTTNYTLINEGVWNYTTRELTGFNFTVNANINLTEITNSIWGAPSRNLTYYEVTQINESEIALKVWQFSDRNLTYYEISNLTTTEIWNYANRALTEFNFTVSTDINYSLIANMVWAGLNRTLTEFNFTININNTAIADAVWNSVNKTLSDYNQSDLTNYDKIQNMVWNATIRTLTDFNISVNATVNNQAIAGAVWNYTNKTVDFATTGSTENVSLVENIRNMGHTYVGNTEYIQGTTGKVAIRLIRGTGELAEVEPGAECYISITYPNATYYVNMTLMTELGDGAYYYDFVVPSTIGVYPYYTNCNVTTRKYFSLDTFHVYENNYSEIPKSVWNYSSGRNLTYYEVGNNLSANDVWNSPTRELTYYPTANLTLSNESATAIASAIWGYNGTVSQSLISSLTNPIVCKINKLWHQLNPEWGVYITTC